MEKLDLGKEYYFISLLSKVLNGINFQMPIIKGLRKLLWNKQFKFNFQKVGNWKQCSYKLCCKLQL